MRSLVDQLGLDAGRGGVDRGELQRGRVDVDQRQPRSRQQPRGDDAAGAAARAHVDDVPRLGRQARDRGLEEAGEAVGVGAEEHRVAAVGREGGMEEQVGAEAGDANPAAQLVARFLDRAGALQQREQLRVEVAAVERAAPAEDVAQGRAGRSTGGRARAGG